MRLVKFIECEVTHDKMRERIECYINPEQVCYIEDNEEHKGYCFIGFKSYTTIVKGTATEIKEKLEGKSWRKILHLL